MKKLNFLAILYLLIFFLIIVKLFFIQVRGKAPLIPSNYLQFKKIKPLRGTIYDRNYQPLVLNQTTYLLYAEPPKIDDKKQIIKKLSEILSVEETTISARFDETKQWVVLKRGVDEERKKQIEKLKILGIGFEEEERRYYPEGSLAAHLLGFVGKNEKGEDVGYFGIEGYWERDLAGLPGIIKTERDILGMPIFVGIQEKINPENGRDLVLTVDKNIQIIAKEKLKNAVERYKAKGGCVIVVSPMSLEVIAMTCLPDFDPEKYYDFSEEYFKNPAISDLYEPGSIFKPLIMAAALNEKKIRPSDYYDEKGPVEIDGYQIRTWDNKYEGKISMTRILEKSSNVGMVYVGQKLGREKILFYLKQFGFGELTGIDLQGEVAGNLRQKKDWYPIDYAAVTFGQGIAVTPIQMVRAFSSLVNGGILLKPYVVKEIHQKEETPVKKHPQKIREVISPYVSFIIRRMLESVVDHGEVKWAKPKGYRIGGKTGTAQVAIKGYYDPHKTIASFIGFAPVEKPVFLVFTMIKEPTTSIWGSETAAPLFFEIAKELLVYYNIAPEP